MFDRDEINAILFEIQEATITDEEMILIEDLPYGTDEQLYFAIAKVLNSRTGEGIAIEKLKALALLNGVEVTFERQFFNNITVGYVL